MNQSHLIRRAAMRRAARLPGRTRKGSALFLTLVVTMAVAGLAMSAILLTSSTGLLSKYYDRERDYRYAAEWALQVGLGRLGIDTTLVLPDTGYITLMSGQAVTDAGGNTLPRVKVDLYVGATGNTTGQFGKYASLVAVARDTAGARHVRRMELVAENFARYAVFTNTWDMSLCYATGELIRGRAHSNQNWQSCGPPGPDYKDTVSAVGTFYGTGIFERGNLPNSRNIPYPTVARLASLPSLASAANMNITAKPAASGGTRIQFVTVDLNGDGDTTDPDEGFIMVFDGDVANDTNRTRAGISPGTSNVSNSNAVVQNQCGDVHTFGSNGVNQHTVFVPVAVHNQTWVRDSLQAGLGATGANAEIAKSWTQVLLTPGARCYPAGDPHLVATERNGSPHMGGQDTTFTDTTNTGHWRPWPGAVSAKVTAAVGAKRAKYLWPLDRSLNPNAKGVIYVNGSVYVSGELRGRVTLYASQDVKLIDDLTYTTDPSALPICQNLLGIIAGWDVWIADNAINRPRLIPGTATAVFLDDNQDFFLHGVTLSLGTSGLGSFRVENYWLGPDAGRQCNASPAGPTATSGGCINQVGGFIVRSIDATFSGGATGFAENRQVDACMASDSPPFFPLTGKYVINRWYEIDPARFNVGQLFQQLQGGT